jgi:hypothetical protein
MKYLMMMYETKEWEGNTDADKRHVADTAYDWHAELIRLDQARATARLMPPETATIVRNRGGVIDTKDGPYAETKEVVGGIELVECDSLAQAQAAAARFPGLPFGIAVELRPLLEK